jgi:transcriptional regulator of heat shock response
MDQRQAKLLTAIIDHFIDTAIPVGSKELLGCANFALSGATIRNEMRALGEEGFLEQPHISAGRIPTAKGYRLYVKEHMQPSSHEKSVRKKFEDLRSMYFQRKDQERVYDAVSLLSQMMPNIAFATVPHKAQVYFVGLANALRQPEFSENPLLTTRVVEVLEQRLTEALGTIEIDDQIQFYIGEDHILDALQSCSLMVTSYKIGDAKGTIGILGPMRMDYAYNTVALEMVAGLLRHKTS